MKSRLAGSLAVLLVVPACADEPVTINNFARAETDTYFRTYAEKRGAFGNFWHIREPTPIGQDRQDVIRMNQDTLYSWLVLDLSCAATVIFPESGGRYVSMMKISQDHDIFPAIYNAGTYELTQEEIGTPYMVLLLRTFIDAQDAEDVKAAHALQDRWSVKQSCAGWTQSFSRVPVWDQASLEKLRGAFGTIMSFKPDGSRGLFGKAKELDRLNHLVGTAVGWAGLREEDTLYDAWTAPPEYADGKTPFTVRFRDVPIEGNGFWSFTLYNKLGFMYQPGPASFNSISSTRDKDGGYTLNFGACQDKSRVNCLPITEGWNYVIRMYRPGLAITDGSWKFPKPIPQTGLRDEL